MPLGYYGAKARIDHRFRPGAQVQLVDENFITIGADLFRLDACRMTGSNYQAAFDADLELRPTRLSL